MISSCSAQAQDALSPAAFAPAVRGFAAARQLAVRHLAARALAPLVPPGALRATLAALLRGIPAAPPVTSHNEARSASPFSLIILPHACMQSSCPHAAFSMCVNFLMCQTPSCDVQRKGEGAKTSDACMRLWRQVHGRLLQLRFLLEATSSSALLPAELAELLALAAEGLTRRAHLLGSCRAAVVRAEYLRTASALAAALLLPQAADLAAACQPGNPAGAEDAPWPAADSRGDVCSQHGAADPAARAAATAEALASSPAFACFAAVLQQGCRQALRLPLRTGCGSTGSAEVQNNGACSADAHNPMLSLFLKEAALLLFGPSLSRMLSLGGNGSEGELCLRQ